MLVNLLDFDRDGLIGHCASLGEKPFRATQLFRWIHQRGQADFDQIPTEEVIREGEKPDEIMKLIEEDEDIAILVLGAATDTKGPGPLVSSLAAGSYAGSFPIPIVVVPGNLTLEDLKAMA